MPVATRVRSGTGAASSGMPQFGQTAASSETFIPQFGHDCHVPSAIRFPPLPLFAVTSPRRRPPFLSAKYTAVPFRQTPTVPSADSVSVPIHRHRRRTRTQTAPFPSRPIDQHDEPTRYVPTHRRHRQPGTQTAPFPSRPIGTVDGSTRIPPATRSHPAPAGAKFSGDGLAAPHRSPPMPQSSSFTAHRTSSGRPCAPKKGDGNHHEH